MSNYPGNFVNEEEVLADMISEEDGSGGMKGATKLSTSKMPTNVTDNDANGDEDGGSDDDGMDNSDKCGNKAKSPNKRRASTIDRRRERNRVLARKSRLRKKFFFESLRGQVMKLVAENKNLNLVSRAFGLSPQQQAPQAREMSWNAEYFHQKFEAQKARHPPVRHVSKRLYDPTVLGHARKRDDAAAGGSEEREEEGLSARTLSQLLERTGSPVLGWPVAATFTAEEEGPALKFQCVRHMRGEI